MSAPEYPPSLLQISPKADAVSRRVAAAGRQVRAAVQARRSFERRRKLLELQTRIVTAFPYYSDAAAAPPERKSATEWANALLRLGGRLCFALGEVPKLLEECNWPDEFWPTAKNFLLAASRQAPAAYLAGELEQLSKHTVADGGVRKLWDTWIWAVSDTRQAELVEQHRVACEAVMWAEGEQFRLEHPGVTVACLVSDANRPAMTAPAAGTEAPASFKPNFGEWGVGQDGERWWVFHSVKDRWHLRGELKLGKGRERLLMLLILTGEGQLTIDAVKKAEALAGRAAGREIPKGVAQAICRINAKLLKVMHYTADGPAHQRRRPIEWDDSDRQHRYFSHIRIGLAESSDDGIAGATERLRFRPLTDPTHDT